MPDRKPRRKKPRRRGNKQDTLDRKQMADNYGYAMAFLKSDDELWALFQKAVKNNWTRVKFQTELLDSKWFKSTAASRRQGEARKASDPATFRQEKRQMFQKLQGMATQFSADMSRKTLERMAEDAIMGAWTDEQIANHMAKFVEAGKGGHYGGSMAAIEDQVRSTAYRNGVRVNRKSMETWMQRIVRGQTSMEEYENHIRNHAARSFKAFAQEIQSGMDLVDVASPYLSSAQAILELEPNRVDLFDPSIRKALTRKNDKGQTDPMGLAEFEEHLRRDPRWRRTSNARESVMEAAYGVSRMMGLRA